MGSSRNTDAAMYDYDAKLAKALRERADREVEAAEEPDEELVALLRTASDRIVRLSIESVGYLAEQAARAAVSDGIS